MKEHNVGDFQNLRFPESHSHAPSGAALVGKKSMERLPEPLEFEEENGGKTLGILKKTDCKSVSDVARRGGGGEGGRGG